MASRSSNAAWERLSSFSRAGANRELPVSSRTGFALILNPLAYASSLRALAGPGINCRMPHSLGRPIRSQSKEGRVVSMRTAIDGLTIRDGLALVALLLIYRAGWSAVRRVAILIGIAGATLRAFAGFHLG